MEEGVVASNRSPVAIQDSERETKRTTNMRISSQQTPLISQAKAITRERSLISQKIKGNHQ